MPNIISWSTSAVCHGERRLAIAVRNRNGLSGPVCVVVSNGARGPSVQPISWLRAHLAPSIRQKQAEADGASAVWSTRITL